MTEPPSALLPFLLQAAFISLSGVMAPGPLTAVIVGEGNRSPHAGALVALGHGAVEFPLMALLLYGFGHTLDLSLVRPVVDMAGAVVLLVMGTGMIRGARTASIDGVPSAKGISPLWRGALLTAGNPYFLVWWATVGAALLIQSTDHGRLGTGLFALTHWLCDFVWFYFLSALVFRGGRFFGRRFQHIVFAVCGAFLLLLGIRFGVEGMGRLMSLGGG